MKISDFLVTKAVCVDLQAIDKSGVIEELVNQLIKAGAVDKKYKKKVLEI